MHFTVGIFNGATFTLQNQKQFLDQIGLKGFTERQKYFQIGSYVKCAIKAHFVNNTFYIIICHVVLVERGLLERGTSNKF